MVIVTTREVAIIVLKYLSGSPFVLRLILEVKMHIWPFCNHFCGGMEMTAVLEREVFVMESLCQTKYTSGKIISMK